MFAPSLNVICLGVTSPTKRDRKSTRLNSSHSQISYAVFCLKKKTIHSSALSFRHRLHFLLNASPSLCRAGPPGTIPTKTNLPKPKHRFIKLWVSHPHCHGPP